MSPTLSRVPRGGGSESRIGTERFRHVVEEKKNAQHIALFGFGGGVGRVHDCAKRAAADFTPKYVHHKTPKNRKKRSGWITARNIITAIRAVEICLREKPCEQQAQIYNTACSKRTQNSMTTRHRARA